MHNVEIRTQEPFTVAALDHTGSYMEIGKSFEKLHVWAKEHALIDPEARAIAMYYDDPAVVPEAQLRSKACVEVSKPEGILFDSGVARVEVPGGEYAVFTYVGPYSQLASAYRWLYGEWLPASGRQAADAPVYEIYLNDCRNTPPPQLQTEICLPLRT